MYRGMLILLIWLMICWIWTHRWNAERWLTHCSSLISHWNRSTIFGVGIIIVLVVVAIHPYIRFLCDKNLSFSKNDFWIGKRWFLSCTHFIFANSTLFQKGQTHRRTDGRTNRSNIMWLFSRILFGIEIFILEHFFRIFDS